jgi:signal transduction histidine kinase
VLSNLLGNAVKYTPRGGRVIVRAARAGDQLAFEVEDTGPGLSAEAQAHVFERFWQAPETAAQGAGLGLYIARGIVEAHGGRIEVESEPGHGALFRFTLPAPEPPPGSEAFAPA